MGSYDPIAQQMVDDAHDDSVERYEKEHPRLMKDNPNAKCLPCGRGDFKHCPYGRKCVAGMVSIETWLAHVGDIDPVRMELARKESIMGSYDPIAQLVQQMEDDAYYDSVKQHEKEKTINLKTEPTDFSKESTNPIGYVISPEEQEKVNAEIALDNMKKRVLRAVNKALKKNGKLATLRVNGNKCEIIIPIKELTDPKDFLVDIPIKVKKLKLNKTPLTVGKQKRKED